MYIHICIYISIEELYRPEFAFKIADLFNGGFISRNEVSTCCSFFHVPLIDIYINVYIYIYTYILCTFLCLQGGSVII
jgi:hypothetical protein